MTKPIEQRIIEYLSEELENIPVVAERIDQAEYVLVDKTGSGMNNRLLSATIALQSYSDTLYKASNLNERVKMCMDDFAKCTDISKSKLNSDYNSTDTTKKAYRYQAVYDVVFFD